MSLYEWIITNIAPYDGDISNDDDDTSNDMSNMDFQGLMDTLCNPLRIKSLNRTLSNPHVLGVIESLLQHPL
eukprot:CAMPEP_0118636412 /NCGR_PEP_ID=MMETSP0785-20121206/2608_1 /TAXON_ID=91992 /ORGANISM="Bolidomonas pacifica, Strain CCMP 1866" /LENGTH=71 /DNA_ID=CAMNT_0006527535 /DNA_START=92 /DNA_END=304 /DNA_ORIENTATION=+